MRSLDHSTFKINMTSWNIVAFIFGACFVVSFYSGVRADGEDCSECAVKMNSSIELLRNAFLREGNIRVSFKQPCEECTISGLDSVYVVNSVCSSLRLISIGAYYHELALGFKSAHFNCTCKLPASTKELTKIFDNYEQDVSNKECATVPVSDSDNGTTSFSKLSLNDTLKLKECNISALTGDELIPKLTHGSLNETWTNIITVAGIESRNVYDAKIVNMTLQKEHLSNAIYTCGNGDELYQESCHCLLAMTMVQQVLAAEALNFIPCYVNGILQGSREVTELFSCLNNKTIN